MVQIQNDLARVCMLVSWLQSMADPAFIGDLETPLTAMADSDHGHEARGGTETSHIAACALFTVSESEKLTLSR
jgi:hypothetical protein